jgi:hypothetical protein
MTERNGARLAAVLPADTQLDPGANPSPVLNRYPYESTYAFGVKNLKGVVRENTPIYVRRKEPPRIVAA